MIWLFEKIIIFYLLLSFNCIPFRLLLDVSLVKLLDGVYVCVRLLKMIL